MLKDLIVFIDRAISLAKCVRANWLDAETKAALITEFVADAEKLKREVQNVLR